MKFIFITLFFVSNLAFAQTPPTGTDASGMAPAEENQDIMGTISEPTIRQKKHVKAAAKKAKMKAKKTKMKVKKAKKAKKNKTK